MYFGGIWGGQLQRWNNNKYDSAAKLRQADELAILPRIAKLSKDMKHFEGDVKEVQILDKDGKPFKEGNNDKRFFEAAWMHKYKGTYYFPIQPAIHTIYAMPRALVQTGRSRTRSYP